MFHSILDLSRLTGVKSDDVVCTTYLGTYAGRTLAIRGVLMTPLSASFIAQPLCQTYLVRLCTTMQEHLFQIILPTSHKVSQGMPCESSTLIVRHLLETVLEYMALQAYPLRCRSHGYLGLIMSVTGSDLFQALSLSPFSRLGPLILAGALISEPNQPHRPHPSGCSNDMI